MVLLGKGLNRRMKVWKVKSEGRLGCVGLDIFLMMFDNFSEGVFGNVSVRKGNFMKDGTTIVLFRVPSSNDAAKRAMARKVALNGKVDECLGDEAA